MATAWDIEERVEDAFVAYLKSKVSGEVNVYPGYSSEKINYPCASVYATESDMVAMGGTWHNARTIAVDIAVITEAADMLDASAHTTTTARERNAQARSTVVDALAVLDSASTPAGLVGRVDTQDLPRGLAAELDAMLIPGVWICSAVPSRIARSAEADKNALVSVISLSVIAQPVPIGGAVA